MVGFAQTNPCTGELLKLEDALALFSNDNFYTDSDGSLILTDVRVNKGFIRQTAYSRNCVQNICTVWKGFFLPAPGDVLRPQLKIIHNQLLLVLDRACQGSYGHGANCSFNNGELICEMIPGTPQCGGWGHPTATAKYKGFITNSCLHLEYETQTLRLNFDASF